MFSPYSHRLVFELIKSGNGGSCRRGGMGIRRHFVPVVLFPAIWNRQGGLHVCPMHFRLVHLHCLDRSVQHRQMGP